MRSTQRVTRNFDRHPDTANYRARSLSAGATISGSLLTATDKLIKAINSNGLRAIVRYLICPSAQDNFIGFNVPILDDGVGVATNNGFVASDWNRSGILGDGSSKYLDTLWNPSTKLGVFSDSKPDIHIGVWISSFLFTGSELYPNISGGESVGGLDTAFGLDYNPALTEIYFQSQKDIKPTASMSSGESAYILGQRTEVNYAEIYKNNVLADSRSTSASPIGDPNTTFFISAFSGSGSPSYYGSSRILLVHYGSKLTQNQEGLLFNLLSLFKIAIGA